MTDIDDLIARVKAATGPDELLDTMIENFLGLAKFTYDSRLGGDADHIRITPAAYTSDLNATRAVTRERGWLIGSSDWHSGGGFLSDIWTKGDNPADVTGRHDHTEPLACCLALLMAIKETSAAHIKEIEGPQE